MTRYRPLDDFVTPIGSGYSPTDAGRLSPARLAELLRQLADLERARQIAAVEARSYVVLPGAAS